MPRRHKLGAEGTGRRKLKMLRLKSPGALLRANVRESVAQMGHSDAKQLILSERDRRTLEDALRNPPAANQALRELEKFARSRLAE